MASLRWDSKIDFDSLARMVNDIGGDADEIAKECVDDAVDVLADSFRSQIRSRASDTGELANSISATKAKKNQYGVFAAARPVGTHSGGVRNGELLAYIEYGTSKVPARPVRAAAVKNAESKVEQIIQNRFDEEINKRMK